MINKTNVNKIVCVSEFLGWNVSYNECYFLFSKFSPMGQDFSLEIYADTVEELQDQLTSYYNGFDVSYETYIWLDETGHGKNGAPYDMKDLYEDIEECERMLSELNEAILRIEFDCEEIED